MCLLSCCASGLPCYMDLSLVTRDNKDSRGKQLQQFSTIRQRKTTRSITDATRYWRISALVATTDRLRPRAYPARINGDMDDMNLSPWGHNISSMGEDS